MKASFGVSPVYVCMRKKLKAAGGMYSSPVRKSETSVTLSDSDSYRQTWIDQGNSVMS